MREHPFQGPEARRLAAFTWIITIPWFIRPVYGLLSDFVPLFGTRRRSYFLIMSATAALAAVMVENGKRVGLTGAFQSVQWGALSAASILVGVGGGYLAERRAFAAALALVACFPVVSFLMALLVVREPPRVARRPPSSRS